MAPETRAAAAEADNHQAAQVTAAQQNEVAFDEKTLADRSIAGNTKAFEELYAHYYPKVRGYCLRKTSNPALAEDIAQEAFARAFERIEDFGGPKHFGGWVGTIAANLITDHYRRKRNQDISLESRFEDPDRGPSYSVDPIRNLQRSDTSRLVKLALEKLDPRQREALMMHEVKGMTCAAVGDALGISEVAAESLLARARRRLRKEITAKATPADLFGLGGLGFLPALVRAWKRARDAAARRTAGVQAAAGRAFDSVGTGLIPTVDGAKALVVVMGAALAVEVASAAAPDALRNELPTPAVTASQQASDGSDAGSEGLLAPDGDNGGLLGDRAPADVDAYVDPHTGARGVQAEGEIPVPAPGSEGHAGLNTQFRLEGENLDNRVVTRIFVRDEAGEVLLDTGTVDESINSPSP